ncbi:uncharacterized protein LOC123501715 [Portunus trituberculatus]|uniref:uncharacterized protein LOC123501715 n=1 Tax=Portunus trituberculatus TaxID=210409 RepID=UPI001E1CBB5A|nr:uncharacterized protein LOC123501715 [Portunus trituberculatus]
MWLCSCAAASSQFHTGVYMEKACVWNRTSEALLLELVREKRFLWDPKDHVYHKTKLRQEAFKSIAEALTLQCPELSQLNGDQVRHSDLMMKGVHGDSDVALVQEVALGEGCLEGGIILEEQQPSPSCVPNIETSAPTLTAYEDQLVILKTPVNTTTCHK